MTNVVLVLLIKCLIDNQILTITTDDALFNEKVRKQFNMLFLKNLEIN